MNIPIRFSYASAGRRRGTSVAWVPAVLLLVLATVLGPVINGSVNHAQAHDSVAGFAPEENETLDSVPESIRLTMQGNPLEVGAKIVVADAAGRDWSEGTPVIEGTVVEQRIAAGAPAGKYTVQWRVVSADGHPVEGTYDFTVSSEPVSTGTATTGTTTTAAAPESAAVPSGESTETTSPSAPTSTSNTAVGVSAALLIAGVVLAGLALLAVLVVLVRKRPDRPWHLLVLAVAMMLVLVVLTFLLARGMSQASGPDAAPAEGSADAGFARDMQQHHAQAVDMAMVIRDRSSDEKVRTLAYDIALTQEHQIGQMFAWLQEWGLPQGSDAAPMAWATAGHTDSEHPESGHDDRGPEAHSDGAPMVGMATKAELATLRKSSGENADRLFLTLMIRHHEGGVAMAKEALESASTEQVRSLAEGIITAQQSEIRAMEGMLAADPESDEHTHSEADAH